jgi:hypothetical protein
MQQRLHVCRNCFCRGIGEIRNEELLQRCECSDLATWAASRLKNRRLISNFLNEFLRQAGLPLTRRCDDEHERGAAGSRSRVCGPQLVELIEATKERQQRFLPRHGGDAHKLPDLDGADAFNLTGTEVCEFGEVCGSFVGAWPD